MTPENPEAVITIVIAGLGYGIYIGGDALQKKRQARPDGRNLPLAAILVIRQVGAALMIVPVLVYVGSWLLSWLAF